MTAYASWSVVFGEQPSAAKWNILGTNDASFNDGTGIADSVILPRHLLTGTGSTNWAWSSWVPTWTNLTIGNAVVTAKYLQHGKTVRGFVKVVFGTTSAMGAAPTFTAPVTASSMYGTGAYNFVGVGYAEDAGAAALNSACAFNASTTAISVLTLNTAGTYGNWVAFGVGVPATYGTNDFFNFPFMYEAA